MSKSFENRNMSQEQIIHDLTLTVVRTSIEGFQRGNDYQVSDIDIAQFAFNVYEECYPKICELALKK